MVPNGILYYIGCENALFHGEPEDPKGFYQRSDAYLNTRDLREQRLSHLMHPVHIKISNNVKIIFSQATENTRPYRQSAKSCNVYIWMRVYAHTIVFNETMTEIQSYVCNESLTFIY